MSLLSIIKVTNCIGITKIDIFCSIKKSTDMSKTIELIFIFDKKHFADAFSNTVAMPGSIDPLVHLNNHTYEFVDVLETLKCIPRITNIICRDVLKIIADYCAPVDLLNEDEFCYETDCFGVKVSNRLRRAIEYRNIFGGRVLHANHYKITMIGTGPMDRDTQIQNTALVPPSQQLVNAPKLHINIDDKIIFNASENSAKILVKRF